MAAVMQGIRWFGFEGRKEMREAMPIFVLSSLATAARFYNHFKGFGNGALILVFILVAPIIINSSLNSIWWQHKPSHRRPNSSVLNSRLPLDC